MKTLKSKIFAGFSALAVVFGIFLSVNASEKDKLSSEKKSVVQTGHFYRYTSSSTDQTSIQNINNYERSDEPCPTGDQDVCGVLLPTDASLGQQPNSTEFDAVKSALWQSQDDNEAANSQIRMKN